MGNMSKYVGCTVINQEGNLQVKQPEIISSMESKFNDYISGMKKFMMPLPSHYIVMRPDEHDDLLNKEEQKKYRSGVGILLYLIKHSRPDVANAVRELSKVMDAATIGHFKMLLRVMKFVVDTRENNLSCIPKSMHSKEYEVVGYCDSDFSGDTETRHSVTGYVVYVLGFAIAWKSKLQRNVTLSSTEAEYVAISEVCKEIKFIVQVMEFLGMEVKKPIKINVDNVGAIYLANNKVTSQRTKHIDVRYHYVRELIEDGLVEISFIRSGDNDADLFTKNLDQVTFWKHANKLLGE
jgi:hypothetical protein